MGHIENTNNKAGMDTGSGVRDQHLWKGEDTGLGSRRN